jgi:hypothetical protein
VRFSVLVFLALDLCGCAGASHSQYQGPIVDMTGVDPVKYNNDLGQCTRMKQEASFIGAATLISDCMADRGYRVIEKMG